MVNRCSYCITPGTYEVTLFFTLPECTRYLAKRERITIAKWCRRIWCDELVVDARRVGAVQVGQRRASACEFDDGVVARDGTGIGHAGKINIWAAAFLVLTGAAHGDSGAGKGELFIITEAEVSPCAIGWCWLGRGIAHAYCAFLCINGRSINMHGCAAFRAKCSIRFERCATRGTGLLLLHE